MLETNGARVKGIKGAPGDLINELAVLVHLLSESVCHLFCAFSPTAPKGTLGRMEDLGDRDTIHFQKRRWHLTE